MTEVGVFFLGFTSAFVFSFVVVMFLLYIEGGGRHG